MENVKDVIAKNLVLLRRSHKLTQQQLGERINYSDKAVSRWEHGETLPDIETLCRICDIYGVRFEYLLQEEQPKRNNPYVKRTSTPEKLITMCIAACTVWVFVIIAYVYCNIIMEKSFWTLFIWALPITSFVCQVFNKMFFSNKVFGCVLDSVTCWTLILGVYLQLLEYNVWMLFLGGIPLQAIIILTTIMKIKSASEAKRARKEET
jgi:transcriptional regulator with XRE-family HTH domain